MSSEVYVDMDNKNSLVSLAFLQENSGNPYRAFTTYIKYCMTKSAEADVSDATLQRMLDAEFGLALPRLILSNCIKHLLHEQFLTQLPDGAGYRLKDNSFDTNAFDAFKTYTLNKERQLIDGFIHFCAEQFSMTLSYDEARAQLLSFLLHKGVGTSIFLNGSYASAEDAEADERAILFVGNDWLAAKYVSKSLEERGDNCDYLISVVNGLMICIGTYQIVDAKKQLSTVSIKGTDFFLDTKLILRLLGCAWDSAVSSTEELVNLITTFGGRVAVFAHTLREVENALQGAIAKQRHNIYINDDEMRFFCQKNKGKAAILDTLISEMEVILRSKGIRIEVSQKWTEAEFRYNLDWPSLEAHIKENRPKWNTDSILYDIQSVNAINVRRKGDYSKYYGGRNRLPVFVTSNTSLVRVIKEYQSKRTVDVALSGWTERKLPIISDSFLMCRLWLPQTQINRDLPLHRLMSNAVAAQQPNANYFEKLKATAHSINKIHPEYSGLSLLEMNAEGFVENLFRLTGGNLDEISVEYVASSVEELIEMGKIGEVERRELAEKESALKTDRIVSLEDTIIQSCAKRLEQCTARSEKALHLIEKWPIFSSIVLAAVGGIVSLITQAYGVFAIIILPALIKGVEFLLLNDALTNKMLRAFSRKAWNRIEPRFSKSLTESERPYKSRVIAEYLRGRSKLATFYSNTKQ